MPYLSTNKFSAGGASRHSVSIIFSPEEMVLLEPNEGNGEIRINVKGTLTQGLEFKRDSTGMYKVGVHGTKRGVTGRIQLAGVGYNIINQKLPLQWIQPVSQSHGHIVIPPVPQFVDPKALNDHQLNPRKQVTVDLTRHPAVSELRTALEMANNAMSALNATGLFTGRFTSKGDGCDKIGAHIVPVVKEIEL